MFEDGFRQCGVQVWDTNGHTHLSVFTIEKTDTNGIMTNSKNKPDDYLIITLEIMQNNKFLLLAKQNWAVFCYSQLKTCNMKTYVLTGIMLQHFAVWLHGLYQNSGLTLLFWWLWMSSTLLLSAPLKEVTGPMLCLLLPRSFLVCWLRSHNGWYPGAAGYLP